MPAYTVLLQDRDFSPRPASAGLSWAGARCSWSMLGGPDQATLSASGEPGALEELLGCLRCPVELLDAAGQAVWWGYLSAVRVSAGGASIGVGLDRMANAVSVRYRLQPAGSDPVWLRTAWAEDTASIAEFGRIEHIARAPARCTTSEAEALAASLLARMSRPSPVLSPRAVCEAPAATLECRGWWHTLEWLYYGQAAGLEQQADHAAECALGMGFSGPAGWFEPSTRRIWDLYGRWAPFHNGQRFRVAGTLLNNGDFAVAEGTARAPWLYASATISFSSATSEMSDAAAGLLGLRRGDIILVSGSQSNDGWHRVETAFDGGARVTLTPGPLNEAAGATVTLGRGNSVVVDRPLVVESAPAGSTVSAQLKLAQRVQLAPGAAGWPAGRISLWLGRTGDPAGGLRAGFQADAGGAPSGTWLSYADVLPAAISLHGGWVDVTLPAEVALSASVARWLVVERTDAADPWSYYRIGTSSDCGYGRGALWHFGGQWQTPDPAFELAFRCEGWQQHGEQLEAALSAAPFLTGAVVEPTPGLSSSPYRPGDERLSDTVAALLAAGGDDGGPLRAIVTRERNVRVERAPGDVRWQIGDGGRLLDLWGGAPSPAYLPVGELAAVPPLLPSSALPFAAAPSPTVRIEQIAFDLETGEICPS